MRLLTNRLIRTKMRRIFQTLTLICTLLVLISLASKWSSKPVLNDANRVVTTINHSPVKSLPSHQVVPANVFVNPIVEKPADGRPDFPKYVHLDLKGAPPKVARFYEDFFDFIEELDMGVKGVLIEYEDMLPLVGRLQNVSRERERETIEVLMRICRFRPLIVSVIPKRILNLFKAQRKLIS